MATVSAQLRDRIEAARRERASASGSAAGPVWGVTLRHQPPPSGPGSFFKPKSVPISSVISGEQHKAGMSTIASKLEQIRRQSQQLRSNMLEAGTSTAHAERHAAQLSMLSGLDISADADMESETDTDTDYDATEFAAAIEAEHQAEVADLQTQIESTRAKSVELQESALSPSPSTAPPSTMKPSDLEAEQITETLPSVPVSPIVPAARETITRNPSVLDDQIKAAKERQEGRTVSMSPGRPAQSESPIEVEHARELATLDERIRSMRSRSNRFRKTLADVSTMDETGKLPADVAEEYKIVEQQVADMSKPILDAVATQPVVSDSISERGEDQATVDDAERRKEIVSEIYRLQEQVRDREAEKLRLAEVVDRAKKATIKYENSVVAEEHQLAAVIAKQETVELEKSEQVDSEFADLVGASQSAVVCATGNIDAEFNALVLKTKPAVTVNNATANQRQPSASLTEKSHVEHCVNPENPIPYRVLYDYEPFEDSPNPEPQLELHIEAGELIQVISELSEDGFYMAEKDGPQGTTMQGLVPSTFIVKFDSANPLDSELAVKQAQQQLAEGADRTGGSAGPAEASDDEFVMVNTLTAKEVNEAEAAVDYVVVGQLSKKEAAEAKILAARQKTTAHAPNTHQKEWVRHRQRGPILHHHKRKKSHRLSNDDVIASHLQLLAEKYEVEIKKYCETKAYGAPNAPTEKFTISGEVVSLMRKGKNVLAREGSSWVPAKTFFKKFSYLHGLKPITSDNDQISASEISKVAGQIRRTQRDLQYTKEEYKGKQAVEHSKVELLQEQIAATGDALRLEQETEDSILTDLQGENAKLHNTLYKRRHRGRSAIPRLRSKGVPTAKAKLTIDEAITHAIAKALVDFPDLILKETQTRHPGNFRTYTVNINSKIALLTVKADKVLARKKQAWIPLKEYLADAQAQFELEKKRKVKVAEEQRIKKLVALEMASDIKNANKADKYRQLTAEYERDKQRFLAAQREGSENLGKEHIMVEVLEEELSRLVNLQKAARSRRHELLEQMEDKNRSLVEQIAAADDALRKEEVSNLVFANSESLSDKQAAAAQAKKEYEALKDQIEIDTAHAQDTDFGELDALLKRYDQDEANAKLLASANVGFDSPIGIAPDGGQKLSSWTPSVEGVVESSLSTLLNDPLLKSLPSQERSRAESSVKDSCSTDYDDTIKQQNVVNATSADLDVMFNDLQSSMTAVQSTGESVNDANASKNASQSNPAHIAELQTAMDEAAKHQSVVKAAEADLDAMFDDLGF